MCESVPIAYTSGIHISLPIHDCISFRYAV